MPWELETADFCATKPQLCHCSEDEVVEVMLAFTDATQLGEFEEKTFCGLGTRSARLNSCSHENQTQA